MNATLGRILSLLARGPSRGIPALDGFVDGLLQGFENCRPSLADSLLAAGGEEAERFFLEIYEKETPRLLDAIRREEPHLTPAAREEYFRRVDELVRKVVVPAYTRVALRFTRRERNAFFLAPEPWHGLERAGWAALAIALALGAIEVSWIPIWSKAWVLPFLLGGLVYPTLRRVVAMRVYEGELNRMVARADAEIARIDTAYLESAEPLEARAAGARPLPRPETLRGGS